MNFSEYLIQNSHCPFCKSPIPTVFMDFKGNELPYTIDGNVIILQITQGVFRNIKINVPENAYYLAACIKYDLTLLSNQLSKKKICVLKNCSCSQNFKSNSTPITFNADFTIGAIDREIMTCKISPLQITNNYKYSKTSVIDTKIEPPYSLVGVSSYREFPIFSWEKLQPEQILKKIKTLSIFS